MEEFCTWFTSSFRLDKFDCFSRFFIHKKTHRRSGIELSFINMAAGASAITRSQEYISFRSSVPLKRVSEKAVHIHTIFTKFIAQKYWISECYESTIQIRVDLFKDHAHFSCNACANMIGPTLVTRGLTCTDCSRQVFFFNGWNFSSILWILVLIKNI